MPFTPSHVAAILPFARTPLLPAALAIGAMAPDLFYFLPIPMPRSFSHSWLGVVTVDLALGIVVYLLWQLVFRRPVIDFSPLWVRQRMRPNEWMPTSRAGWLRFALLLIASLLLGSATHVVWDLFTHPAPFALQFPLLAAHYGPLQGLKWLQHASSVIGVLALIWFTIVWARRTPISEPAPSPLSARARGNAWLIVVAAGLVASLPFWLITMSRGDGPFDWVFQVVVSGLAAAGLVAIVICLFWHYRIRHTILTA